MRNNRYCSKDINMAKKYMKMCSVSLILRERKIKTTMKYYVAPVRIAVINNAEDKRSW